MKQRFRLLIATAIAVALLSAPGASAAPGAGVGRADVLPSAPAFARSAPTVSCARPSALRLIRFEDGSAQLRCGRRILTRISAPG